MTQQSPSTLLYAQAMLLIQELNSAYNTGLIKDTNDLSVKLADIITRFEQGAGTPFFTLDLIDETEPPLSRKMNKMWATMAHDISILQNQVDVLRASAIATYNNSVHEIDRTKRNNARLLNKLKTLQMYSDNVDSSIITFGDSFASTDFFDHEATVPALRADIIGGQNLSLGISGQVDNLSATAIFTVLDTSNGFLGNNQEVDASSPVQTLSDGQKVFSFYGQTYRSSDLKALGDGSPNSWIEYEQYEVKTSDRRNAGYFNFKYIDDSKTNGGLIDWAKGPKSNVLKLDLQIDLKDNKKINKIRFSPFGLRNIVNSPVKINLVELSSDGSVWVSVNPSKVWVGTEVNLQAARTAKEVMINEAVWTFEEQYARYVRIHIEQPHPYSAQIGHLWYEQKKTGNTNNEEVRRVAGPNPPLSNPLLYSDPSKWSTTSLLQHREIFNGSRWAIGIRDILVQRSRYAATSNIVTRPLRVGSLVDRVSLEADVVIPDSWDANTQWVKFYISPDNGLTWFQISRIQDDYMGIPEMIAFNDPTPPEFQDPGVAYYQVSNAVDTLRLKIELSRPSNQEFSTPLVKSYRLKVKRR